MVKGNDMNSEQTVEKLRYDFLKCLKSLREKTSEQYDKILELNKIHTDLKNSDLSEVGKGILKDGFNTYLRDLAGMISSNIDNFEFEINKYTNASKLGHTYDIYNNTENRPQSGLHASSFEKLREIFRATGEKITLLREYDSFGILIYENTNPDTTREDSLCEYESSGELECTEDDMITQETVKNLYNDILDFETNAEERNVIHKRVHYFYEGLRDVLKDEIGEYKASEVSLYITKNLRKNIVENSEIPYIDKYNCGYVIEYDENGEEHKKFNMEDKHVQIINDYIKTLNILSKGEVKENEKKEDKTSDSSEENNKTEKKIKKSRKMKKNEKKNPKAS